MYNGNYCGNREKKQIKNQSNTNHIINDTRNRVTINLFFLQHARVHLVQGKEKMAKKNYMRTPIGFLPFFFLLHVFIKSFLSLFLRFLISHKAYRRSNQSAGKFAWNRYYKRITTNSHICIQFIFFSLVYKNLKCFTLE